MTQNIYGLTRNTRPRGVQFILSGSKQFRKNGGPHLKGSRRPRKKVAIRPLLLRRPKVVFFGAQAEKNFFFFRGRLVMVFGGQITFSNPPKTFSAPTIFFRPPMFFFRRLFCLFGAQNQKSAFSAGAYGAILFGAQAEKPRLFFFFFGAASLWCSAAK